MATLGSVTCDIINEREAAHTLRQRTETWQTPGVDGYGAQTLGRGDSAIRFEVVKYDNRDNLETWIGNVEAVQGTVVSITDNDGVVFTNVLVTAVRVVERHVAYIPGGTNRRAKLSIDGVKVA